MITFVRNDPRTPLERALNVDPDTCRDRVETSEEKARRKAKEYLKQKGVSVVELPGGRWRVVPEYPKGATAAERAAIDGRCDRFMRYVASGAWRL